MEKYLYCANCADILSGFHCYNCDRALIYGDELFEEAEEFYKINDECYCKDCIDKFKIDIWDIYQEENGEEC